MVNVIGVAVVDALSGSLERYPEPAAHPQVNTRTVTFQPGGGAVNSAATLAHLGIETGVFTKVGDDVNGRFVRDTLQGYGVNTSGMILCPTETTPFTFVGIHPHGDRTFIHTPGANLSFCADDIDSEQLFDCAFLLYQDLHVLPQLDGAPGAALLAGARRRGIVTLLDECWGLGPDVAKFELMAAQADYVLPSEDELMAMYPGKSLENIAARLRALGTTAVCVKQGAKGCTLFDSDGTRQIPAMKAVVVDTTGAGDSFDAGFVAALAENRSAHEAAEHAIRIAARRVSVVGGSGKL